MTTQDSKQNHEQSQNPNETNLSAVAVKLIDAEARLALRDADINAGGEAELNAEEMLPQITQKIGWRQKDGDIEIFTQEGEGPDAIKALVSTMVKQAEPEQKQNTPQDQIDPNATAPKAGDAPQDTDTQDTNALGTDAQNTDAPHPPKTGSGAQNQPQGTASSIDAGDPLALGHALNAIAKGHTQVRF